jgi:hypothetical protein
LPDSEDPDLEVDLPASANPVLGADLAASALSAGLHDEIANVERRATTIDTCFKFVGVFCWLNTVRRYYRKAFQYTLTGPHRPQF